ncbi:membrane signaling protein [Scheffersomyces xylosifermentans]|uniref:membrane signaling protein n=1 Tax=Scheffersomyces xylosifermentans TaxID=1304137 RepID=UPI00315DAC19
MKFGESLSEGLVPEWKEQYLDYKSGKKFIKRTAKLKDEFEIEASKDALVGNDRTPLLNPQEGDAPSYTLDNESAVSDDIEAREQDLSNKGSKLNKLRTTSNTSNNNADGSIGPGSALFRRPSIFNFSKQSFSSKSKDKKEEYEQEKERFTHWLDKELEKVDLFFREKEQEVYERFLLIQDQLYQLRDHKASILMEKSRHDSSTHGSGGNPDKIYKRVNDLAFHTKSALSSLNRLELPSLPSTVFLDRFKKKNNDRDISMTTKLEEFNPNYEENRIRNGMAGFTFEENDQSSIDSEETNAGNIPNRHQEQTAAQIKQNKRRDYTTKKQHFGVPYLYARKQLKVAILEHYRALSLLRSFRILNRTAFRKITKKFDKTMKNTSILTTYMKKIDQDSYFQTSDLLDKLTNHVEELFIAFFDPETTDRKHSLEKLKSIAYAMNNNDIRQPTYYQSFFASGFMMGFGIPLFVLGLYVAVRKTFTNELPEAKFMLQIWGGFFLLNFVLILFGINLAVFDRFKINYKFIFEFDIASALNYRQFWLLPSFGFCFLSLIMWFSFQDFWPDKFAGRDWPWIYFGVMLVIFLWPGNQLYASARKWLQIALWRLFLSGLYPVEFRDFFLGDILCSLTYTMGNLSFFFCLYAHHWNGLLGDGADRSKNDVCGSSKSRLMGFFSTLPSIWRFLQCVRRYMDTGDWFPHLANMVKYAVSALYYILLSVYRIDRLPQNRVTFIVFAIINSLYAASWDIVMDWSLLQSGSRNKYLRDNLFFKKPIYYYVAIVADVILRFQWIFYAFFSNQIQQSAVTSFFIATAEIIRRFIWIFFRMENEHCTNVILFRASKDSPLPYTVSPRVEKAIKKLVELRYTSHFSDQDEDLLQRLRTTGQSRSSALSNASYISSRQYPPNSVRDEEMGPPTSRVPSGASFAPQLIRRKSTFSTISDALNKAHIKDFQRRKTTIALDDFSDEDEEEEEDNDVSFVTKKSSKLPSVIEGQES